MCCHEHFIKCECRETTTAHSYYIYIYIYIYTTIYLRKWRNICNYVSINTEPSVCMKHMCTRAFGGDPYQLNGTTHIPSNHLSTAPHTTSPSLFRRKCINEIKSTFPSVILPDSPPHFHQLLLFPPPRIQSQPPSLSTHSTVFPPCWKGSEEKREEDNKTRNMETKEEEEKTLKKLYWKSSKMKRGTRWRGKRQSNGLLSFPFYSHWNPLTMGRI